MARARHKHRRLATLVVALLLASFIFLLLVAISLPIVRPIYLLSVHTTAAPDQPPTSIATELRFGVWGFCATSVLNQPTLFTNRGDCTHPRLGYAVDPALLALTGQPQLLAALLEGLVVVLVLHPVCAALAGVTLLVAVLAGTAHAGAIAALVLALLTALVATVSAVADVALVAVARPRVGALTGGLFDVAWGNAPWLSIVAAVFTWVAVVLLSAVVCRCCGLGRERRTRNSIGEKEEGTNLTTTNSL